MTPLTDSRTGWRADADEEEIGVGMRVTRFKCQVCGHIPVRVAAPAHILGEIRIMGHCVFCKGTRTFTSAIPDPQATGDYR